MKQSPAKKLRLSSYSATQRAESDDIYQEVLLQLLAQLQKFRKLPDGHPIADLRGIAAVIAHRTCAGWMRRQFPERHALKNRLHYLVTRQRGFALWQSDEGQLLAGFTLWQEEKKTEIRRTLDLEALPHHIRSPKAGKPHELADTVAAIFNHVRHPIEFDLLVTAVASLLGISDQPIESVPRTTPPWRQCPIRRGPIQRGELRSECFCNGCGKNYSSFRGTSARRCC